MPPSNHRQASEDQIPRVSLLVTAGSHAGKEFSFRDYQTFVVGRGKQAQLRLSSDPTFSRYHCRFEILPPECRITDLGSRNGTFVNGARITEQSLSDGDEVTCADTTIRVRIIPADRTPAVAPASLWATRQPPDTVYDPTLQEELEPAAPELVGGYRLGRKLGAGGMGVVYHGVHVVTGAGAAVKLLMPTTAGADQGLVRFLREVSILGQLRHPRIVELREFGLHVHQPYLVMEYLPVIDLQEFLSQQPYLSRMRVVCGLVCRMLEALQFAHGQNIVHRDIKPSNLLPYLSEGKLHVKLADFGLAKNFQNAGLSALSDENSARGTLAYMAPEQLINSRDARPACDIFSAGACLYTLLSGQTVFPCASAMQAVSAILNSQPAPLRSHAPGVPPELAAVVDQAVARAPGDRFASAEEMRNALLKFTRREEWARYGAPE